MLELQRFHDEPLDRWLAQLPAGWDSYPECRMKGAMVREMLAGCALAPATVDRLPAAVASLVRAPPKSSEWVPCALGVGMLAAAAKLDRWSLDRLRTMARASTERLSSRVGLLLALTTPSVLMLASRLRWGLVYRGVDLDWRQEGRAMRVFVRYPPHLFTEFFALGQGWGLEPALEATRARNVQMRMVAYSPTESTYEVGWD